MADKSKLEKVLVELVEQETQRRTENEAQRRAASEALRQDRETDTKLYELTSARIDFEEEQIRKRVSWMLTIQAILFVAFVTITENDSNSSPKFDLETFQTYLPIIGIALGGLTLLGVFAAYFQINRLMEFWEDSNEQDSTEQDSTEQDSTEQDSTEQDSTEQDSTRDEKTFPKRAGRYPAMYGGYPPSPALSARLLLPEVVWQRWVLILLSSLTVILGLVIWMRGLQIHVWTVHPIFETITLAFVVWVLMRCVFCLVPWIFKRPIHFFGLLPSVGIPLLVCIVWFIVLFK